MDEIVPVDVGHGLLVELLLAWSGIQHCCRLALIYNSIVIDLLLKFNYNSIESHTCFAEEGAAADSSSLVVVAEE